MPDRNYKCPIRRHVSDVTHGLRHGFSVWHDSSYFRVYSKYSYYHKLIHRHIHKYDGQLGIQNFASSKRCWSWHDRCNGARCFTRGVLLSGRKGVWEDWESKRSGEKSAPVRAMLPRRRAGDLEAAPRGGCRAVSHGEDIVGLRRVASCLACEF